MVQIAPPVSSVTTSQVFSGNIEATSAMSGIYSTMINGLNFNFTKGAITIYPGASSDEFNFFSQTVQADVQFQNNTLLPTNTSISPYFWALGFTLIYQANAIIDGLNSSNNVSDSVKNELIGEAKFIRAFSNFYLINLFGDIPLVTTINYHRTSLLPRTPTTQIYLQIISDLNDAENSMVSDYSVGKGERIVPNKWAAQALFSRVYLYLGEWVNAENKATGLINNSALYDTVSLNGIFQKNSKESIWQLQQTNAAYTYNATPEGYKIIPRTATSQPFIYLTTQMSGAFETGDKRKKAWVDSTKFPATTGPQFYYPKKYKIGPAQAVINGAYTEYYMIFRLAEQYLIRAEARAKQGNLNGAIADLNVIRNRAGLPLLPGSLNQQQVIAAIEQENRIEFFAEWGHRWFDLKRWGRADAVLGPIKGSNWQTTDLLYPIPQNELITDPNLTQNPGY